MYKKKLKKNEKVLLWSDFGARGEGSQSSVLLWRILTGPLSYCGRRFWVDDYVEKYPFVDPNTKKVA